MLAARKSVPHQPGQKGPRRNRPAVKVPNDLGERVLENSAATTLLLRTLLFAQATIYFLSTYFHLAFRVVS